MEESMSFEQRLEYTKEILQKLMDPEITLQESVKLYEEGLKCIKEAQKMIEEAKLRVEEIEKGYQESEEE